MEACGIEVRLRWHSLLLWLLLQAHCHSSPTSRLTVNAQTTISFRLTWQLGHHSLEMSQKSCQPNSYLARPGVLQDKALVEDSLNIFSHQSILPRCLFSTQRRLAVCPTDCLVWIKVKRRGSQSSGWLCVPLECQCRSMVDARGVHSFVCKKAPGRTARRHTLNDLIARSFASASFFLSPRSQRNCSGQMESDLMVLHLYHGRVARNYVGASP